MQYIYILLLILLHFNISAYDKDILKQEIEEYQSSNEKTQGWTPLQFAVENGYNEMAALYAKEGYDHKIIFDIIDKRNYELLKTYLSIHPKASNEFTYKEITEKIEPNVYNATYYQPGCRDFENKSALIYVIEQINEETECLKYVKLLIENGADVNAWKPYKYCVTFPGLNKVKYIETKIITPVGAGLFLKKWSIVNYLIPNISNSLQQYYINEMSAQFSVDILASSIENDKIDTAQLVIQNLITHTSTLYSYINSATANNKYEAVALLINNGAKPSVSNVEYAIKLGFYDIADLLSETILTY